MSTRARPPSLATAAPPSVSERASLRNGLPAVYRETWETAGGSAGADLESPFVMRLLKALEEVLDPIVTVLDCLPAHLDPKLASAEALREMARWLGLPFEEQLPRYRQQSLVENAVEISRSRGTARGLQLLLELMFARPDGTGEPVFTVDDGGYVVDSAPLPDAAEEPAGTFVVQWTQPFETDVVARIKRVVQREKPVTVRCVWPPSEESLEQAHREAHA